MKTPAVIYARFSSENQRQESIEGQLRECRQFADRNNFQVIAEYTDSAQTGRTDRRPGFQKMIRDAERQTFQTIIVWKLDRFARNRYDSATYRARLKKLGIDIVSAKEYIPDGAEGIIIESLMEGMAEYYSANLAENVRRGLYESALARKVITQVPLGYRKSAAGCYEINEDEADIVRRIFDEYTHGKRPRDITADLNAQGFRNQHGRPFTINGIIRMLHNEKYCGIYRYEDIYDPEGIPAIVSKDTYNAAQDLFQARRRTRSPRIDTHYLLSGKLFCGLCDRLMTGEYAKSASSKIHYYYYCIGAKQHECEAKRIRRDPLEAMITEELTKILTSQEFQDEITDMILAHPDEERASQQRKLDGLRADLSAAESRHENMLKAIEQGIFSAGLSERLQETEALISELKAQILELDGKMLPEITREDIEFSFYELNRMRAASPLNWQRIIDILVSRIYVFPDHVVILLNYPGQRNRIDLQLVKDQMEDLYVRMNDSQGSHCVYLRTGSLLFWSGVPAVYVSR